MRYLIKKHQKDLEKLFRKEEAILAYLFGSAVEEKTGPLSDIDIAVLFSEKVKRGNYFDKRLKLALRIDKILKTSEIEVICLNEAPPLLKHRAIFYGISIFAIDSNLKRDFEFRTLQEYEDFNYHLKTGYKIMEKQIKERVFGKAPLSPKQEKFSKIYGY